MTVVAAPVSVGELLAALLNDERATVVTPNRRLARTLKNQFDGAQRDAGKAAWATPDIVPLATFFERTYQRLRLSSETSATAQLLDAAQSQLLWQEVVRASDLSSHLLSVAQTARQAAAAWTLAEAWDLWPRMRGIALSEDAQTFIGWAQRFQQLCHERDVIDAAGLPAVLGNMIQADASCAQILPLHLFAAGFDIVTPQQQQFFDVCLKLGISVRRAASFAPLANAEVKTHRVEFATDEDELRAVAAWARARVQTNPAHRIAIVVPDLAAKRGKIARALSDALHPGQRAVSLHAEGEETSGFNISLGKSLNDYALVHDALGLIAFAQNRPLPFSQVSALLRSPFIAGANSELAARAGLDAALREVVAPEMSLFALQRTLKVATESSIKHAASRCPTLLALIDRVASMRGPTSAGSTTRKPSPRDWSRQFGQVLLAWGFPGEQTLDTFDFQIVEKFRDALTVLATLEKVQPRMRAEEAHSQLRTIVGDTVFQPEAAQNASAPIQVLGILESVGQSFDALWVTGLDEQAWPLAVRPNPFIPAMLQRAAGVIEASAAASLAFDQRITAGWRRAAREVIFSHAEFGSASDSSEQRRGPSALTREIALTDAKIFVPHGLSTDYAQALFVSRQREPIPDTTLAALPTPMKVSGGATMLRDQSACAFRAFARHRLGARTLATPMAGMDASERGTLLHRVLSLVWGRLGNHAVLVALDEGAIKLLVSESVAKAISEATASGVKGLLGRTAEIEQQRLVRLVVMWLEYEKERAPFEVVACEQTSVVALGGLSMRLRLDRLDRLADGTHALIDYKSGRAKVAAWLGERPDEPQLPLYFHTATQTISAIAFARVKRGMKRKVFGFEGVSAVEGLLPDVTPIEDKYGMEKKGYVSWDVLIKEWEDALGSLAKNFILGDARVDPKNGNLTCAQCDLQSLCRISEMQGSPVIDDLDGDAVASVSVSDE